MILKTKVETEEIADGWSYIDGITEITTYVSKTEHCVMVDLMHDKKYILPIYKETYLLNDSGKTIDVIHI